MAMSAECKDLEQAVAEVQLQNQELRVDERIAAPVLKRCGFKHEEEKVAFERSDGLCNQLDLDGEGVVSRVALLRGMSPSQSLKVQSRGSDSYSRRSPPQLCGTLLSLHCPP